MASEREHHYHATITWIGNTGSGTSSYVAYSRAHEIAASGKPTIPGSSDPSFRGDPARWNPEDLLVASLAACHKLWYLHLCAEAGIIVTGYVDEAEGILREDATGSGRFERVVLRPRVAIAASSDADEARALHHVAHAKCFIAKSVNFEVAHEPTILRP